jgi:hypothetical protein
MFRQKIIQGTKKSLNKEFRVIDFVADMSNVSAPVFSSRDFSGFAFNALLIRRKITRKTVSREPVSVNQISCLQANTD